MLSKAAPERARCPKWITCQSVMRPSAAEYWHIGAITMRFASSRLPTRNGVKSTLMLPPRSGVDGERCIGSDESQLTKLPPEVVRDLRFERGVVLLDALGLARTRDDRCRSRMSQ